MPQLDTITYLASLAAPLIGFSFLYYRANTEKIVFEDSPEVASAIRDSQVLPGDLERKFDGLYDPNRHWVLAITKRYDTMSWEKKQIFIKWLSRSRLSPNASIKFAEEEKSILSKFDSKTYKDGTGPTELDYQEYYATDLREKHLSFIQNFDPSPATDEGMFRDRFLVQKLMEKDLRYANQDHGLKLNEIMDAFMVMMPTH
tara:strand:+ start:2130 stop:2732 length:603 start_codon:yes stop_codon:yes gene_type:complete